MAGEVTQHVLPGGAGEVEADGALAGVEKAELDRVAVSVDGGQAPVGVALRCLDLDDVGAQAGHEQGAVRGKVELPDADHLHAFEGRHPVPPCLS